MLTATRFTMMTISAINTLFAFCLSTFGLRLALLAGGITISQPSAVSHLAFFTLMVSCPYSVMAIPLTALATLAGLAAYHLATVLLTTVHMEHLFQLVDCADEIRCLLFREAIPDFVPLTGIRNELCAVVFVCHLHFFLVGKPQNIGRKSIPVF